MSNGDEYHKLAGSLSVEACVAVEAMKSRSGLQCWVGSLVVCGEK